MRFIGLLCVLLSCLSAQAQVQTKFTNIGFTWTNPTPASMPACSNVALDSITTTPTNCQPGSVTCSSDQLMVETDSAFATMKSIVSQTIAPTANSFILTPLPAVGTHYYLLVATGRTASGAQCISGPATTSVVVPNQSTPPPPTGQTLPPRTGFSGIPKQ